MPTTYIRTHERTSQFRADGGVHTEARHARWLYKNLRQDGLERSAARMALVHTIRHGQRDAGRLIANALRSIN